MGIHILDHKLCYEKAQAHFEKAYETAHDDEVKGKALYNLGKVFELLDDKDKACEYYEKVLKYNKQDYKSMINFAVMKQMQGKNTEAMESLQEASKIKNEDRRLLLNSGIVHRKCGLYEKSSQNMEKVIELY